MSATDRDGKAQAASLGRALLRWTLLALALAPVALYALLGSFSRLMADDWSAYAAGLYLGGRDNFFSTWNNWSSSFAKILLVDLLAPLGAISIPQISPAVILAIWLIGLAWLLMLIFRSLGVMSCHRSVALMLAGFAVSATVAALPTWESVYWHAAAIDNSLPLGVLLLFLAASVDFSGRAQSPLALWLAALAGAVICFVNAGFSEMHSTYQAAGLVLLLVGLRLFVEGPRRAHVGALLVAGLAGTVASILLQLTAPGIAVRMEITAASDWSQPIRSLPALIGRALSETAWYLGNPGTLAGFTLVFLAGLGLALIYLRSPSCARIAGRAAAASIVLAFVAWILPIGIGLFSIGFVFPRVLAAAALMQTLAGLSVGFFIGALVHQAEASARSSDRWRMRIARVALLLLVILTLANIVHLARLVPDFAAYAREWDARHQRIIQLREGGLRDIKVAPFSFDMSQYIAASGQPFGGVSPYFYQVDSVVIREG